MLPAHANEGVTAGELKRITDTRDSEIEPVVTPYGKHVLYTALQGEEADIHAYNLGLQPGDGDR
jgi:hypothetical protein